MRNLPIKIVSLVFAITGGISSLILLMERFAVLQDPNYQPSCSWSPIFSCMGPMASWQSSAIFGIPNYAIGLVGFAILSLILILSFQVKLPKWVWVGYMTGALFAVSYCMWLMTQTLYEIGALCIYCMIIWTASIAILWLGVRDFSRQLGFKNVLTEISYTNDEGDNITVEEEIPTKDNSFFFWLYRLTPALMIANYLIVISLVYFRFFNYFNYLLGFNETPVG
jgi:uncharacterized membrane protein